MFCVSVGTYHFPQWNTSAILLASNKLKKQTLGLQERVLLDGLWETLFPPNRLMINFNKTLNLS